MNTDLIKKLIKLANNNPNENEANLAARKVCKLLEGYEFPQPNVKVKNLSSFFESIAYEPFYKSTYKQEPKSHMRCTKCGKEATFTSYKGDASNFVCSSCQWIAYVNEGNIYNKGS